MSSTVYIKATGTLSEMLENYATNYLAKNMAHCDVRSALCIQIIRDVGNMPRDEMNTMWHMHLLRYEEWSGSSYSDKLARAIVPVRCRGDYYNSIKKLVRSSCPDWPDEYMEDIIVFAFARAFSDDPAKIDLLKIFSLQSPRVEIKVEVGTLCQRSGELDFRVNDEGDICYMAHRIAIRKLFFNAVSTECFVNIMTRKCHDDDEDFVVDDDEEEEEDSESDSDDE